MTQVEDEADIPAMANEIRELWIEGEYEDGHDIPEPVEFEYSGKFVTRLPKTLHRQLAEAAKAGGMSLNTYVVYLLGERNLAATLTRRLDERRPANQQDHAYAVG